MIKTKQNQKCIENINVRVISYESDAADTRQFIKSPDTLSEIRLIRMIRVLLREMCSH